MAAAVRWNGPRQFVELKVRDLATVSHPRAHDVRMTGTGLIGAVEALDGVDIGAADSSACADLLRSARRVRGWLDSREARIGSRLRVLHDNDGAAPAADVHARAGGVSAAEGRRRDRRAEAIESAPCFGEALADGAIGAEHVDALANATTKLDDEIKSAVLDCVDDLLTDATCMSPEQFARSCRDLTRRLERDQGVERNRRQRRDTFLSRRLDAASGMIEGRFAFHPELAEEIFGPIDREVAALIAEGAARGDADHVNRTVDRTRLAAEALGRLVVGGHQQIRPAETEILVIVDAVTAESGEVTESTVCETSGGAPLPPPSVQRLMCNGRVVPIVVDQNGNPFEMGRTIRHANRPLRRALRAMYRCCAFDGCDVTFERCEMHHVRPWELGGSTDLANLLPLCSRHHHVVHDGGWRLELANDRTLTITQPDGRVLARCRPDIGEQRTRHRRTAA